MSSRFFTALTLKRRPSLFLVALISGAILLVVGFLSSLAVHSGQIASQLEAGSYSLRRPLLISSSPLVRIDKGTIKFQQLDSSELQTRLLGILPSQWTELFTLQKISDLTLQDAVLTLDLRGTPSEHVDPQRAIGLALESSYLKNVSLVNSSIHLLQEFARTKIIQIKQGEFSVDLPDREFEGSGLVIIDGKEAKFTLENDFSKQDDDGMVLNQIKLELENDLFSGYFNGTMAGRHGLFLKGKTYFKTNDAHLLSDWLDIASSTGVSLDRDNSDINLPAVSGQDVSKGTPADRVLDFSVSGQLDWAMNEGTLSNCSFGFNDNIASGSLSLRLSQANPEISGTLAFPMLDLSPQTYLLGFGDRILKPEPGNEADSRVTGYEQLGKTASYLYKLIRNYDADIRMSAQTLKIGKIELEETGFSLFQRNGEFIVDMAGVTLFDGHATGLVKIDTNFPKPRWHMNVSFNNIEVSKLSAALELPVFFKGAGDLKLHITSYGDKISELYQNMFGALNYSMNKGGVVKLDMKRFIGEQELSSSDELEGLSKGSSAFSFFSSKGHFGKGSVVLDHFMLRGVEHEFTGLGNWHIPSEKLDLHIASWPHISLKASELANSNVAKHAVNSLIDKEMPGSQVIIDPTTKKDIGDATPNTLDTIKSDSIKSDGPGKNTKNDGSVNVTKLQAPELLACSHIYGSIGQLHLEKFTGLHLSLLKRNCAATYRLDQLKTKDHPIVRTDNAG